MTTVTESDIQEIKNLILALEQKLMYEIIELKREVNNVNTKVEANNAKIDAVSIKVEVNTAKIDANNFKIDTLDKRIADSISNLDKRVSNQEFIYRAVVIGIIGLLLTPLATNAVRYFWENPLFPLR